MTEEKFIEILDEDREYDSDFKGDRIFEGLKIMSKYTNDLLTAAEHDEVYGPQISELVDAGITVDDVTRLGELNWHVWENECVAHFA